MDKNLVTSFRTLTYMGLFLLAIYMTYTLKSVFLTILVALVITLSIERAILHFQKVKFLNKDLGRTKAVLLSYFLLLVVILSLFLIALPPMVKQAQVLFENFSEILVSNLANSNLEDFGITQKSLSENFKTVFENIFATTYNLLSGITVLISIIILALYMSLEWTVIKQKFGGLFPADIREAIQHTFNDIEDGLGHWVKGQLSQMAIVGAIAFVGLSLIGVPYPLALALIGGLLEIIPILGPLIATILIAIVALSDSITTALLAIGFYLLLQQFESNFLVPRIMHKVSGFSPVIIIIALLIGETLAGIVGAIIAIPTTMVINIIFKSAKKYLLEHRASAGS